MGRVKAAAEVRLTQERVMQSIGRAIVEYNGDVTIDPLQSLMRMVQTAAWAERAYAAKLKDMTDVVEEVGSVVQGFRKEPDAYLKLWNEERDRLAKFSKLALDAGVEEKQVKLAQAQVTLTADALDGALGAAGITAEQRFDILQDMARRLKGA